MESVNPPDLNLIQPPPVYESSADLKHDSKFNPSEIDSLSDSLGIPPNLANVAPPPPAI